MVLAPAIALGGKPTASGRSLQAPLYPGRQHAPPWRACTSGLRWPGRAVAEPGVTPHRCPGLASRAGGHWVHWLVLRQCPTSTAPGVHSYHNCPKCAPPPAGHEVRRRRLRALIFFAFGLLFAFAYLALRGRFFFHGTRRPCCALTLAPSRRQQEGVLRVLFSAPPASLRARRFKPQCSSRLKVCIGYTDVAALRQDLEGGGSPGAGLETTRGRAVLAGSSRRPRPLLRHRPVRREWRRQAVEGRGLRIGAAQGRTPL